MIAFCCDWCGVAAPGKTPADVVFSDGTIDEDIDEEDTDIDLDLDAIMSSAQYGAPSGWFVQQDSGREWHACSERCCRSLQQRFEAVTQSLN